MQRHQRTDMWLLSAQTAILAVLHLVCRTAPGRPQADELLQLLSSSADSSSTTAARRRIDELLDELQGLEGLQFNEQLLQGGPWRVRCEASHTKSSSFTAFVHAAESTASLAHAVVVIAADASALSQHCSSLDARELLSSNSGAAMHALVRPATYPQSACCYLPTSGLGCMLLRPPCCCACQRRFRTPRALLSCGRQPALQAN